MTPKDLYVLTADADALAVMNVVLSKHRALGIRKITFDVDRHPGRDSGMVQSGPDLARLKKKSAYRKVLLIWDHDGSGWERRHAPEESKNLIQDRLDRVTWKDNSSAIVLVPELEEWLWHNPPSIWGHLKRSADILDTWIQEYSRNKRMTVDNVKAQSPKELFEYIMIEKARSTISPRDFEEIARRASIKAWCKSKSFHAFNRILAEWFPEQQKF